MLSGMNKQSPTAPSDEKERETKRESEHAHRPPLYDEAVKLREKLKTTDDAARATARCRRIQSLVELVADGTLQKSPPRFGRMNSPYPALAPRNSGARGADNSSDFEALIRSSSFPCVGAKSALALGHVRTMEAGAPVFLRRARTIR